MFKLLTIKRTLTFPSAVIIAAALASDTWYLAGALVCLAILWEQCLILIEAAERKREEQEEAWR